MNMNVLTNLKFNGSSAILDHTPAFPTTPQDGMLALVNGIVYIYTKLNGMTTWYPLTNEKSYYIHSQGLASTTWEVTHNLHSENFVFVVYDETSTVVNATHEPVNADRFKLHFTKATKGKVVCFFAADGLNVDKVYGISRQNFIAVDGQSNFPLDVNFQYDYSDVFINGIKLYAGDYSINTNVLTLNLPVTANSTVEVTAFGDVNFTDYGVVRKEFTATAGQTEFLFSHYAGFVDVYLNGMLLNTSDYVDSNEKIVLSIGATAGDELVIKCYEHITQLANYEFDFNSKINYTDTVNNLTSASTTYPLSADQGRVLKTMVDNINVLLSSNDTTLDQLQEVVDFIKLNKSTLDSLSISNIAGLQNALDSKTVELGNHTSNINNPHNVTKSQVGLGNVDNTSDSLKPISIATQNSLDGKLSASGGTMTGAITGLKETSVTMGANDINLSLGNLFTKTITGATTLSVSNVPVSGTAQSFILELTNGGVGTISWWSGVKWAAGVAPTLTTGGVDILGFYTYDGGMTWRGIVMAKDSK